MLLNTYPFARTLACAAISPGLRSILVLDATPDTLQLAAQTTTQMLEVVTKHPVVPVRLTTFEDEDDLWGRWGLSSERQQLLQWKLGLLAGGQNNSELRLVVISDLTELSLVAARACVVLMGADVANLERHGQHEQWQPKLCWLAGCASDKVGMVSPHLLDRFALRMSGRIQKPITREKEILLLLNEQESEEKAELKSLSIDIYQTLQTAFQIRPKILEEAITCIQNYINLDFYSHRREIALARLSLAIAQLNSAAEMTAEHVNTAAQMIGLKAVTTEAEKLPNLPSAPVTPQPEPTQSTGIPLPYPPKEPSLHTLDKPVYVSDEPKEAETTIVYLPVNPYPEDEALPQREASSLKFPNRRLRSKAAASGPIIGVEKAKNLQDLALVKTLVEAAKFQGFRQELVANEEHRLVLQATDFYSYRRAHIAEQMLTLLLDYTCLRNCNWHQELLPYLSWAYIERASICLIQVGVAKNYHNLHTVVTDNTTVNPEELLAERVLARNVLVPRIAAGLEAEPGKATPLAHGLDVALQTLRHALQHGRSTIQQAVLVVISDGRGNVPLEASRTGTIYSPVGREGVKDALQVAKCIRELKRVKIVLLNPQPKQYANLPLELAQAMGAIVVAIPPLDAVEVE